MVKYGRGRRGPPGPPPAEAAAACQPSRAGGERRRAGRRRGRPGAAAAPPGWAGLRWAGGARPAPPPAAPRTPCSRPDELPTPGALCGGGAVLGGGGAAPLRLAQRLSHPGGTRQEQPPAPGARCLGGAGAFLQQTPRNYSLCAPEGHGTNLASQNLAEQANTTTKKKEKKNTLQPFEGCVW